MSPGKDGSWTVAGTSLWLWLNPLQDRADLCVRTLSGTAVRKTLRVKHNHKPRKDRPIDDATVKAIRDLYYGASRSALSIAKEFGLNREVVRSICKYQTYKNVD
jgi:hypothetical protein